jgi:hypothetical protein
MRMGWIRAAGLTFLLAASAGIGAEALDAQQQERERECRCVDTDGSELEHCVCVRMPDVERIVTRSLAGLSRPRLGISVVMTEPSEQADGALVSEVLEDGPADRAGLREGDIITRLSGRALTAPLDAEAEQDLDPDRALPPQRLLALVRDLEPGDEVEVEYLRDGRSERTVVEAEDLASWGSFTMRGPGWDAERFGEEMRVLGERMRALGSMEAPRAPDAPRAFRFEGPSGERSVRFDFRNRYREGLELVGVNPELGSYFGTDRGVLVASVPEGSALGLEAGDVILDIDGRAADDPDRVRAILASYDAGEAVTFRVRRGGAEVDVSGRVGDG